MCNTGAAFIVVILTALIVGTVCGAVNGFILTQFEELPPMIVTLATQIIFRGIAEIVLGSGGSISASNTDGFRLIGGKVGKVPYILFLVLILAVNLCSDPWKVHFRTQGICNWYKPPHSILLRNPCKEDPLYYLHSYGNLLWTVRPVSGSIILWS